MHKYFTIPNFLSKDECNSLLLKCKNELKLETGTVNDSEINFKSRKSSVAFIDNLGFLNDKLQNILVELVKIKGFSVSGLQSFQFTEYSVGDYYNWHRDNSIDNTIISNRFYSTIIQLNDEYINGELQLNIDGTEITLESGIGNLYMFPSYTIHRIKPITSGVRYSLVNWVTLVKNKNEKKTIL